jgi:hypothetical protein
MVLDVRETPVVAALTTVLVVVVVVRLDEIGGVEKGALAGTDIDKRRLHARQHGLDLPQIDVSYGPPDVRAVMKDFDQTVVLQDGHARLARAGIDENLAFQTFLP